MLVLINSRQERKCDSPTYTQVLGVPREDCSTTHLPASKHHFAVRRSPERRYAATGSHAATDSGAAPTVSTRRWRREASWAASAEAMRRGGGGERTLVRPPAAAATALPRRRRIRTRMSLGSPLRGSSPAEAAAELAGTSPPVRSIERGRFVQLVVCFSVTSPSFLLGLVWFSFQPTLLPVSLFLSLFFGLIPPSRPEH
jgi:hypothetical protein